MLRYNIFNLKHKGLRAMLFETAITLQHTSFEDKDAAEESIKQVEAVLHAFHDHATHEDAHVLPAIQKYDADLVNEFESEHGIDELLTQNIQSLINTYKNASGNDELNAAGYALNMAFNEFVAFNLYHMNKEENKINKVLWDHYSDVELGHITQTIIASIPPQVMAEDARWMMKGTSDSELIAWLRTIKNTAPDQVFKAMFAIAESVLPTERLQAVQDGLMEGAMLA
ncbi:MAG: hemerythrin domain-containing protein [Bacteroidetes bacterium]|jgi:hemerythrin-like domain-containing protein|nr:hemerythrin domain-containing protein [Bacteroidota bacterium]